MSPCWWTLRAGVTCITSVAKAQQGHRLLARAATTVAMQTAHRSFASSMARDVKNSVRMRVRLTSWTASRDWQEIYLTDRSFCANGAAVIGHLTKAIVSECRFGAKRRTWWLAQPLQMSIIALSHRSRTPYWQLACGSPWRHLPFAECCKHLLMMRRLWPSWLWNGMALQFAKCFVEASAWLQDSLWHAFTSARQAQFRRQPSAAVMSSEVAQKFCRWRTNVICILFRFCLVS